MDVNLQNPQPGETASDGACIFGAVPLSKNAAAIQEEIPAVLAGRDVEAIHQIRVASRRLRSALWIFEKCLPEKRVQDWNRQIRSLTRALGKARDTDVQYSILKKIEHDCPNPKFLPGIRRLALRLSQSRQKIQLDVESTIARLEKSGVLKQIRHKFEPIAEKAAQTTFLDPSLYQLAFAVINQRLNEFLAYEVYIRRPEYKDELHAMRIAAKRLRYSMEIFSELYPDGLRDALDASRKSQSLIGEIHDCDIWMDFLPKFIESEREKMLKFYGHTRPFYRILPGLEFFLHDRQQMRSGRYSEFLNAWKEWRANEIWIKLRETILLSIPISKPSSHGNTGNLETNQQSSKGMKNGDTGSSSPISN